MFEERNSALYYKFVGSDVDHLSESKDEQETISLGLKWIGYKNQFFSSALIPDGKFNGALIRSGMNNDPAYLKNFHTETTVDYNPADNNGPGFRFYLDLTFILYYTAMTKASMMTKPSIWINLYRWDLNFSDGSTHG